MKLFSVLIVLEKPSNVTTCVIDCVVSLFASLPLPVLIVVIYLYGVVLVYIVID